MMEPADGAPPSGISSVDDDDATHAKRSHAARTVYDAADVDVASPEMATGRACWREREAVSASAADIGEVAAAGARACDASAAWERRPDGVVATRRGVGLKFV